MLTGSDSCTAETRGCRGEPLRPVGWAQPLLGVPTKWGSTPPFLAHSGLFEKGWFPSYTDIGKRTERLA